TPLSPTPLVMFEEEEVPLSDVAVLGAFEIEEDMIPLAVLPATGDNSLFLMFMSLLSGLSLAGASLVDKMKKRKR
ncbi:MAG: LPXTG cell wall anchor domain-containing protein, partial [Lachnospiraceae bacterium]|nr:LPXTG cell wall anchor domain-containing protein [Lachnospiraceae bacterium]